MPSRELTTSLRVFLRLGWSDGHNESFAYTEVDGTASFAPERWHRKHDKIGAAFVLNALSAEHRQYLALGRKGFLLGEGGLTYGPRENLRGLLHRAFLAGRVRGI